MTLKSLFIQVLGKSVFSNKGTGTIIINKLHPETKHIMYFIFVHLPFGCGNQQFSVKLAIQYLGN